MEKNLVHLWWTLSLKREAVYIGTNVVFLEFDNARETMFDCQLLYGMLKRKVFRNDTCAPAFKKDTIFLFNISYFVS